MSFDPKMSFGTQQMVLNHLPKDAKFISAFYTDRKRSNEPTQYSCRNIELIYIYNGEKMCAIVSSQGFKGGYEKVQSIQTQKNLNKII